MERKRCDSVNDLSELQLHKHARLMFFAYEGRQGYLGSKAWMPLPTEWEIIDDYLSAVEVFMELGVEGHYARANKEVFG